MANYTTKSIRQVTYELLRTMSVTEVLYCVTENHDLCTEIEKLVCGKVVNTLSREEMLNLLAEEYGYHRADRLLKEEMKKWENQLNE